MTTLLRNRPYRLLFSATAVSNLGDGISALAFPWLASLLTRDPFLIALVAAAGRLPWLLFSIPAGVITDRYDRRLLMVRADMFRLVLTFGVIGLIWQAPALPLSTQPLPYILALGALAMLLGTAEVLRDNAAQTVLPSIVPKADLERANGQMWTIEQIMGAFVGPPLAGVLIAWAVPAPFLIDALSFGLAAWLVWAMSIPRRAAPVRRRIRVEVRQGWDWMRAHPVVLRLAVMLGLINALFTMTLTVLILFSQDILGLSAAEHGLLLTAGAAGGVFGGIVAPVLVARMGAQPCLYIAQVLMIVPFVLIALTGSPWIVALALFIEMVAALLWNVITVSYRQRLIPDDLLGRVNSIYRFFGWGMMPVGALAAGLLVGWAEPSLGREAALRLPFWIGAMGSGGLLFYGFAKLRITQ